MFLKDPQRGRCICLSTYETKWRVVFCLLIAALGLAADTVWRAERRCRRHQSISRIAACTATVVLLETPCSAPS